MTQEREKAGTTKPDGPQEASWLVLGNSRAGLHVGLRPPGEEGAIDLNWL